MKLSLLPKLNRNKDYYSTKLTEPSDYSNNSKKNRIFNSSQNTQKTIPYRNRSSSIQKKQLYINNKNNKNKKFNLSLTNDLFYDNKSKNKSLFSSSMTQSYNFFVKKNKQILAQEMINLSKQYLSLNNNSYSRDSNKDKIIPYYKEISPSFNASSSYKKLVNLLKTENNNSKFRNSIINEINNLSTNFRKKSKNIIPNKIKSNLNLSKEYKIILTQKNSNIKPDDKIDKRKKKKSKNKSKSKNNSISSAKGSKNSSKNNIIKIKKLSVTSSKFNSSKTIEKISKSEKKENIKNNTYTIFPSKFKNNDNDNNNKIKLIKKKKEKDNTIYDRLLKSRVYNNILKNPDLELLYNINRKKIVRMIKSQSKNNKQKLSLIDYQNNLLRNYPKLKTENHIYNLKKGFQYLNDQNQTNESESLIDYIYFIQHQELDVINQNNLYNQNLYFKFIELGLSPKKFNLRPEKIEYKDVLNKYK